MKILLKIACGLALGLTVASPVLFFLGKVDDATLKSTMLAGMVLWFVAAIAHTKVFPQE